MFGAIERLQTGRMSIRHWPENERPREKLLASGAQALSDAELLAVFIGSGQPGRSAVDLGRDLILDAGGLRGLMEKSPRELARLKGLGPARASRLAAALELGSRHLAAAMQRGESLTDPEAAGRFLALKLRHLPHEVFACLFLDTRHRVVAFEELFQGTIDGAQVHPREVVRRCLLHNAAAVILAHNHPSGVAEPSAADRAITQRLREALSMIDVRVLDHLVIGDGAPLSFAARGLL
jgi:DNA repair protein RadC